MRHEWITSIPCEVHTARAYRMRDGSSYIIVMRTLFTQPSYPCAVYHLGKDQDWEYYFGEVYRTFLDQGIIMRDMFCSRDLIDIRNGIVPPNEDLGTCLYIIGEIIADGEIIGSKAYATGGRYGRTDIGSWMRLEDGGEMRC